MSTTSMRMILTSMVLGHAMELKTDAPTPDPTTIPTEEGQVVTTSEMFHVEWEATACCMTYEQCVETAKTISDEIGVDVAEIDCMKSTFAPTLAPVAPTEMPVAAPVDAPTQKPVAAPVDAPTQKPVAAPVDAPTQKPVAAPVDAPTQKPVAAPVDAPTQKPVAAPVDAPTEKPVDAPAPTPTEKPVNPTNKPVEMPAPTPKPVEMVAPTPKPVEQPAATLKPVEQPEPTPTEKPADQPAGGPAGSDEYVDAIVNAVITSAEKAGVSAMLLNAAAMKKMVLAGAAEADVDLDDLAQTAVDNGIDAATVGQHAARLIGEAIEEHGLDLSELADAVELSIQDLLDDLSEDDDEDDEDDDEDDEDDEDEDDDDEDDDMMSDFSMSSMMSEFGARRRMQGTGEVMGWTITYTFIEKSEKRAARIAKELEAKKDKMKEELEKDLKITFTEYTPAANATVEANTHHEVKSKSTEARLSGGAIFGIILAVGFFLAAIVYALYSTENPIKARLEDLAGDSRV